MRWTRSHRDGIAIAVGLIFPLTVASILIPYRTTFVDSASALVLIAVVVAVAVIGSRVAGFIASVSASLWFDFFLTRPYEQFAITHRPDIETTICLFVVGIAVTELAARNRYHRDIAEQESDYLGMLYYLSELVADGVPTTQIIGQATAELTELLHLRSCRYEFGSSRRRMNRIEHDGSVHIGSLIWGVHRMGLPGRELELPVQNDGKPVGRFVLEPTPGWPVSMQTRVVAVAIADQVGTSLPQLRSA